MKKSGDCEEKRGDGGAGYLDWAVSYSPDVLCLGPGKTQDLRNGWTIRNPNHRAKS